MPLPVLGHSAATNGTDLTPLLDHIAALTRALGAYTDAISGLVLVQQQLLDAMTETDEQGEPAYITTLRGERIPIGHP
jgi:hypothetical protein